MGKQKPQDWHLLPGCRRGRGMACFCGPLYAVTLSLSVRAPGPDGCRPRAVHFASTRSRLSRKGQKAGNVEAVARSAPRGLLQLQFSPSLLLL